MEIKLDSSLKAISIIYTGVPVVFFTGTHSRVIEVKVLLVTVGMPGVGNKVSSPVNIEEKFFTCVKNSQLLQQLLELFYIKRRKA